MMWTESLGRLPGIATARGYRREWLRADVTAGLVLTALLIPAGMGYAEAAGLPAYAGLYATIVPLLAYAVVGPSKILVLGPDSSLAPLIAAAVIPLAVVGDSENALALAGVLAILVGLILVIGGFLRLGFVTELLSKPIRLGYLNAIALVVVVGQIPKLLGFSVDAPGLVGEIGEIGKALIGGDVDTLAAVVGIGSLVVIVAFRLWVPVVPGVLVAVVAAIVLSAAAGLTDDIGMVGALPEGLPLPSVGGVTWQDVGQLIGPAAGIALIAFADSGVLSRTFAARHGEDVNGSTEMKAIGVANVAGGLFGGFPISASGSRTPVAEQSGAHTQLAGVVGALAVLVFVLVAPGLTA
ncbi:SulP family inorganic anion transporter, partial [Rhodococcus erythropolis]